MLEFLFIASVLPVLLLLYYIYKKDSIKEPNNKLALSYFLGCASIIPIIILEVIVGIFFSVDASKVGNGLFLFVSVFFSVGIIEELFKWIIVRSANYNSKYFDESFDAIVYAVFASLGFATIENLEYVFLSAFGGIVTAAITIFGRFLVAVPGHCFFGIIMGYFFAKAKKAQFEKNKKKEVLFLLLSLFIPTILHTIYDFLLMTDAVLPFLVWCVFVVVAYIVGILIVRKASKENKVFNWGRF